MEKGTKCSEIHKAAACPWAPYNLHKNFKMAIELSKYLYDQLNPPSYTYIHIYTLIKIQTLAQKDQK